MCVVVYVSSATSLFSDEELRALLETSRKNNQAGDITGLLLHKDGNFMQMLEGPEEAGLACLSRIEVDPRHGGILRLLAKEEPFRQFAGWTMGFKRLDGSAHGIIPGRSDFLDVPFNDEHYRQNPSQALSLLLDFKKLAR